MVYIMVGCGFFIEGMKNIFKKDSEQFVFIRSINEINIDIDNDILRIVLVVDLTNVDSLRNFQSAITALSGIIVRKRIGVLVSKLNSWLTFYISKKLYGRVTFFNSNNLESGLFKKNFQRWLSGRTFQSMHIVQRFRDDRYGLSMKEWFTLVIPLSGESISEMSKVLGVPCHSLYQTRRTALKKIGILSWRNFAEDYILGNIRIENNKIMIIKR